MYPVTFIIRDAVAVKNRMCVRIAVVPADFFVYKIQKGLEPVVAALLKQGKETVSPVPSDKTEISGGRLKDTGKIMNQCVSLRMPERAVDFPYIGQVKHDTANMIRQRFVNVLFNDGIAAVAVCNSGYRVGGHGKIQLAVVPLKRSEQAEVHKDEQERKPERNP